MQKLDRTQLLHRGEFLTSIKDILGFDLQRQENLGDSQITQLVITPQKIRELASFLSNSNHYLQAIFGVKQNDQFNVYYLIMSQVHITNAGFLIQVSQSQKEFATIEDVFPNAAYWQDHVSHRLGVQFHIVEFQQKKEKLVFCTPFKLKVPKISNSQKQIGVFNPIHAERSYLNLNIGHGDTISKIELTDGWLYQNVLGHLENKDPFEEIPTILAKISPTCSVAMKVAYFHALEEILEIAIPLKAKFIRTMLAEVERISSHLLWFSNLASLLGLKNNSNQFSAHYNALQKLFQSSFDGKTPAQLIGMGGATDLPPDTAQLLYKFFKSKKLKNATTLHRFLSKPYVKNRLLNRGQLTFEEALNVGLTGPPLRGSGVPLDIRASHPYLAYLTGNVAKLWSISSAHRGDCLARAQVRLQEIKESWDQCEEILHGLTTYKRILHPQSITKKQEIPLNRTALSMVETPQGALYIYMQTGSVSSHNNIAKICVIAPDAQNFGALQNGILTNESVENISLILHSLDLHFPLIDL